MRCTNLLPRPGDFPSCPPDRALRLPTCCHSLWTVNKPSPPPSLLLGSVVALGVHFSVHCVRFEYVYSLYSLPLLPVFTSLSYQPPHVISTVAQEGSSEKRVLILPPYSPTVGVHSVRQLHVGASRLSRVFVSDASGEGITCSCVVPCILCPAHSAMGAHAFAPAIPAPAAVAPAAVMLADARAHSPYRHS
jgi:hypothetical protein